MKNKKYVFRFLFLIMLLCLTGCTSNGEKNLYIFCVDNHRSGDIYVSTNKDNTYYYDQNAIYVFTDAGTEKVFECGEIERMTALEDGIAYYLYAKEEESFCLFYYDFLKKETQLLEKKIGLMELKGCGNDLFAVYEDRDHIVDYNQREKNQYETILYQDIDKRIDLHQEITSYQYELVQNRYYKYNVSGYDLYVDSEQEKEKLPIVLIEKEDFTFSCLPYNTYIHQGEITCIDKYEPILEEVKRINSGNGGIDPSHVCVLEGMCYYIAQYAKGTWDYQWNPSPEFKTEDAFFSYNLTTKESTLLYQTRKKEQIAGYDEVEHALYLVKQGGIYKHSLVTQKEEKILDTKQFSGDGLAIYEYGGMLFVMDRTGLKQERAVISIHIY